MLGSIAQDSKRRERYIHVLAGFKNHDGTIHALILTDKNEKHRVTLRPDGSFLCRHEVDGHHELCPASAKTRYVRRCYHVQCVELVSALFTEDGIMEKKDAPKALQYLYFDDEIETAALAGDKSYNEALSQAYEQLATTKKTSIAGSLSSRGLMRGQRQSSCGSQRIA